MLYFINGKKIENLSVVITIGTILIHKSITVTRSTASSLQTINTIHTRDSNNDTILSENFYT